MHDPCDIHFALRVNCSYRDTLAWLQGKGLRENAGDEDLRNMQLRPNRRLATPRSTSSTPTAISLNSTAIQSMGGRVGEEGTVRVEMEVVAVGANFPEQATKCNQLPCWLCVWQSRDIEYYPLGRHHAGKRTDS
jgi:hypothetical protein